MVSNVALRHGERRGRGLAELMQQPIGAAVQEQAELVGFPAMARGAVGLGVELVLLDHVFHPTAGAIDASIEQLGAAGQVGDDETDVGAFRCGLDAGDDATFSRPAFGPVSGLEEAAQFILARSHPANRHVLAPRLADLAQPGRCREARRCSRSPGLRAGP